MIVYPLACDEGHSFEGWFASAEAFEGQSRSGELQCPVCSSVRIRRLPSAPYVHGSSVAARTEPPAQADLKVALDAMRALILRHTEDVGRRFPEIARRIYYKEEKERGIRGVATPAEAEELREEGVPVYSVPAGILPPEEVH